ncbi:fibrillin-2-like, partial [Biomphalaria glabrata]|uniref:Fibrillin-2-like n=2 Tax=Biomphalaria glabrata TaxID=6526 RepID=A0A9W2YBT1_BIOGL
FGPDCQWNCDCVINNTKLCHPVTGGCDCWKNWTGSYCSADVDECYLQTYSCQPHSHCINSYGGYQCICTGEDGYLTDENGTCYHLDCTYELNNGTGDIMSPQFGYYNYINNANCSWNITVGMKEVISLWFSYFHTDTDSSCQSDYMEVFDGIDESSRLIGHYCGNGVPNVIRTSGNHMYVVFRSDEKSYYAGKIIGTYKSHECHSFTYGIQSCENSCQCVKENTDLCINTNGECVCKPGWMSRDCSVDVNECQGVNKLCPPNSECINTIGSYICKCYLGFVQASANQSCYESKECIIKQCSHSCHVLRPGVEECLCPKGMELDAVTGLVCYVPLYPYGTNNGDLLLEDTSFQLGFKNISRPIYLTSGAPFGEFIKTSVHVSSNGAFGFGDGTFNYGFFSNIHISIKEESIIAPYMTNINPESGRVFYHLYDNWGEKFADAKFKQDSPKMNQVVTRSVNDIKEYYKLNDFEVDFVFITTWENVQPLLLPSIIKETNTFQAVYICGWEVQNGELVGEKTGYVIFLYPYGYMKWSYVVGRLVTVGISGSQSLLSSLSVIVSQLDRVQGNKSYDGVISYEVGRVQANRMCYNYLYKNFNLLNDGRYGDEKDELYKCPTTLERQGAQWELYYDSTFVSPDGVEIHCFAIKPIAKHRFLANNRRNKLCCYKQMKSSTEQWDEWYRNYREAFYMSGHVLIADPKEYISLVQQNILAEQECCADGRDSKSCNRFYKIFPDMGSTDFAEFVTASALGDPHITTLDGLNYTANVWGEYILLEIPSENFTLQARTERYETSDGVVTNATVFTAFAARESNESFFQAELYYSNKSMVLFANGIDITRKFYSSDFVTEILSDQYLSVAKEKQSNKTLVVVSFPCGVTIKVYTAFKSLLIEVNAMETLMNKTQGLLGNFNKNISDDFTLPNGTMLPISSSEKEIYEHFAQEWRVTPSNSLFQYEEGKSVNDYQHDNFTPFFSSSIDLSDKEKAEEFCGSNHHSCVFDYLVTRNQAFSLYTKHVTEENAIVHTNIENHPPTIKVPNNTFDSNGNWLVYQGTPSTLQVLCEDIDQDEIIYELLGDPLGVTINKAGLLTYRPDYNQTISLSFRAKDSKGSYSPVLNIPISICSLCNGHGVCDSKTTRKQSADGLFQIQVCECYPAYTGAYCDIEIDACALSPCFKGQTCTDLSAAEQGNNSVGYRCGQCPLGYKPYLQACVDIDECNETRPCEQKCTNTEGSFLCACSEGYRLSYEDQSTCIDINECEERTSKCHQICNNTEGNYTCDCYPFYTLDTDGFTCNLDGDKTEVRYHCQHIYAVGSFSNNCTCRLGYDRKPEDPTYCIDVNECEYGNKPCSQNCVNLEGSYECSCFVGYQLNVDGVSCEACQEPYYGKNCSYICQCNGRGICDPVRGCLCNSQWTGANCEKDVDECAQPHACKEGMLCINTIGAFKCVCLHGYKLENGVCIDLNECQESLGNIICDMKTEMCINNLGSYTCECKSGFSRNNMSTCVDIDECEKLIDQCEHSCQNVPGTYNCQCNFGYILAEDRQTCNRVKNVCQTHNLSCSYGCKLNHYNLMECYCPKGYQLDSLGQCEDVNECNSETENLCADASLCTNTNGSFTCSCRPGFKLDNDNRSCIACHPSTWGPNCANSCACKYGTDHCSPFTGCVCKQGYTGNQCNIDIDECVTGQKKCEINEKCMNVPGTATCVCQDGFQRINGSCEDMDECQDILTNNCSQQCSNYAGGFTCSCYLGFSFNDGLCQDIDECKLGKAKCEQICVNTEGSYRCTCNPGLVLQTDGLTCKTKVECDKSNNCSYKCSVMNGTDQCYCPKGKTLAQDLNNCDDVNLCEHSHCTFECAETDSNTSYTCMCGLGQYLASNGIDCLDCVEGKWGPLCANTCNCTAVNTLRCDRLSGSCQCKSGWSGPQCEKDIDECVQGLALTVQLTQDARTLMGAMFVLALMVL